MEPTTDNNQGLFAELAYRENDGIEVSLLWNRANDDLSVHVYDSKQDECLEIPVGDASPLHVFDHPYAYAAFRGLMLEAAPTDAEFTLH